MLLSKQQPNIYDRREINEIRVDSFREQSPPNNRLTKDKTSFVNDHIVNLIRALKTLF